MQVTGEPCERLPVLVSFSVMEAAMFKLNARSRGLGGGGEFAVGLLPRSLAAKQGPGPEGLIIDHHRVTLIVKMGLEY